jgi:hypothetical protein
MLPAGADPSLASASASASEGRGRASATRAPRRRRARSRRPRAASTASLRRFPGRSRGRRREARQGRRASSNGVGPRWLSRCLFRPGGRRSGVVGVVSDPLGCQGASFGQAEVRATAPSRRTSSAGRVERCRTPLAVKVSLPARLTCGRPSRWSGRGARAGPERCRTPFAVKVSLPARRRCGRPSRRGGRGVPGGLLSRATRARLRP